MYVCALNRDIYIYIYIAFTLNSAQQLLFHKDEVLHKIFPSPLLKQATNERQSVLHKIEFHAKSLCFDQGSQFLCQGFLLAFSQR